MMCGYLVMWLHPTMRCRVELMHSGLRGIEDEKTRGRGDWEMFLITLKLGDVFLVNHDH